jgi:cytidyltransferase-like protein
MDESFESLFKLILNSFRKMKKRASGIITSGIIDQFNILVSEIAELVSKRKDEAVKESVSSFLDFKKTNTSPKKVDYLTTEAEDREDDPFYSYNDFISSLETVDTKKKPTKNLPKIDKVEGDSKDLVPVNILIGRFQPFHNGHLKMVTAVNEKNDLPCILAVVYNKYNKSDKCPFNEDMIAKYMENVVRENSENIIGYFTVERGLLGPIYSRSKGLGFIPKLIGVGEDVANDYKKQCEYLKKIGNELPEDVEIIETTRTTNGSDVRKKLMDEDFLGFKKLVPLAVSNIYSFLLSSIKGKAIDETVILNTEESKNQQI